MFTYVFEIMLKLFILIWMLKIEFKDKGHQMQTTKIRKFVYWSVWSLVIGGNIYLIVHDIMHLTSAAR